MWGVGAKCGHPDKTPGWVSGENEKAFIYGSLRHDMAPFAHGMGAPGGGCDRTPITGSVAASRCTGGGPAMMVLLPSGTDAPSALQSITGTATSGTED